MVVFVAGSSGDLRAPSYQLTQYTLSPQRNDPYTPGQGRHRDTVARLAELEGMLSSLQDSGSTSGL